MKFYIQRDRVMTSEGKEIPSFSVKEMEVILADDHIRETLPICIKAKEQTGGEVVSIDSTPQGAEIDFQEPRTSI